MKRKKALTIITVSTAAVFVGSSAFAAPLGSAFYDFVKSQDVSIMGIPSQDILKYVSKGGGVNFNGLFTDASRLAYEYVKEIGTQTVGSVIGDRQQDESEATHQTSTTATADSVKFFENNTNQVRNTAETNQTASESSLEAIDKTNQLNAAIVTSQQQQTQALHQSTQAQQASNLLDIQKGQIARTERLKRDVGSAAGTNEVDRLMSMSTRKFYPDANGNMVNLKPQ